VHKLTTTMTSIEDITVKAHLRRYGFLMRQDDNPEMALMEACGCITGEMARAWFRHAGYMWNE